MKNLILILALIVPSLAKGYGPQRIQRYGIEASQFAVQSGFGTSSELKLFVQCNKGKRLSAGIFYDNKLNKIGGFAVSYQILLGKGSKNAKSIIRPYLTYNFIYHNTKITETISNENVIVNEGTYKSLEHYFGIGLRTMLTDRIYTSTEVGYGLYLGSIMKPSKPDPILNESRGTNGTGAIAKVSIGWYF